MVRITFRGFYIENISEASGLFAGDNVQTGWKSINKTLQGDGVCSGDHNVSAWNKQVVRDTDFLDFVRADPNRHQTLGELLARLGGHGKKNG